MKKIYVILLTTILIICALGYGLNRKYGFIQTSDRAQKIYKQGLESLKKDDLQNAYYNFSKISRFNSYYEAALFRQGLIATELNDNESAIKAYETLLYKFPNTFFAEKSVYNLAIAYFNSDMPEQAYANFQLIAKKYKNSDYADAANYFLGVLAVNSDENKAIEHFTKYIKIAPGGKYSLSCIEYLENLQKEFSQKDNLLIGKSLLANKKYDEAVKYLDKAEMKDSWADLSVAYKNLGNYRLSKKLFEDGIKNYTQNGSEIQELAIEEYAKLFKTRIVGLKNAKTLCDDAKCKINDYIMYNLLPSADKQIKKEYYNRIYTEFPDGDYAAEALFNSMFYDYLDGNYENAIIKAKKHISKYPSKKSAPAAMYWLAKTYDKKRNHLEANNYYNKVFTQYTDSYYAFLAASKINKLQNPFEIQFTSKIPEKKINIDLPIIHANLPINSSKKIEELIETGDFKIFEYADFDNEIIKSWVAYYEGDLAKASVIAEKVLSELDVRPSFEDDIYKLAYPIGYEDLINKYATKENKIAPYLLLGLIRKESRFNSEATSITGARGLMQLMPDTAQFIAGLTGVKYNYNELFEPEYNINLGTKYYNYIKSNHHNEDIFAIASYNGGHGAVSKWLSKYGTPKNDELDEFVEQIPYPETKNYIKQVYKNYWVYNCIYNK